MKCPFYIRVEYKDNNKREFIGNLNDYIKGRAKSDKVLSMDDYEVDMTDLVKVLVENKDIINKIYCSEDNNITKRIFGIPFEEQIKEAGLGEMLAPIIRPY